MFISLCYFVVGWATGSAYGLQKPALQIPTICFLGDRPGLELLWKTWLNEQTPKPAYLSPTAAAVGTAFILSQSVHLLLISSVSDIRLMASLPRQPG